MVVRFTFVLNDLSVFFFKATLLPIVQLCATLDEWTFALLSLRRKNKKLHWKSLVGKVQHELKRDSWEESILMGNDP
jgi:hypothetical protein